MRPTTGRFVKGKILRGTPDNVTGDVVTEFEGNLKRKEKRAEAERQIERVYCGAVDEGSR